MQENRFSGGTTQRNDVVEDALQHLPLQNERAQQYSYLSYVIKTM